MVFVPVLSDALTQRMYKLLEKNQSKLLTEELRKQYGADRFKDIPKGKHEAVVEHLEKVFSDKPDPESKSASERELIAELVEALEEAREELNEYHADSFGGESYNNVKLNAVIAKAKGDKP